MNGSSAVLAFAGGTQFAPLELGPATLSGCLYALGVHRLRGTARAVPRWRQACFYAGLILIVVTLTSPLGRLADELFWAHMTEHLLLADVGALLLVLGLTGPLLAPLLRVGWIDRLRALSHPLVALPLWGLNFYLWHVPLLHEAAVRHEVIHAIQHLCFVGFGANMWMALFGPFPKPAWFTSAWQCGYILSVRMLGAVLGNVFVFGGHAFYDVYAHGERLHGITPDGDQNTAGAIMMVWESVLTLLLFGAIFMQAARDSIEQQELLELADARGVALTPERARRAVAAGRGAELRARVERNGPTTPHPG
ncbi:MAG: cytochrome c oxidase assembly protein [Solirubrobacterales bacterium]|nr:cytochrome c oxidase assembly protein [Solirubrobacterales bacterium]